MRAFGSLRSLNEEEGTLAHEPPRQRNGGGAAPNPPAS